MRPRPTLVTAALLAAGSGLASGLLMPRGPVTTSQALLVMAAGLAVGLAAGRLTGSRWAMVWAPVLHVAVMELARIGETGPSVDWIAPTTSFAVIAFLVGRGVYGLVALAPLVLGAALGAALSRGPLRRPRGAGAWTRSAVAGTAGLALVALAVALCLPATVPPVVDARGAEVPGSVAELASVTLGGHDQWIEIRAARRDRPVLLFLSGGPGQSSLPFTRVLLEELTDDMVVVDWDQRGQAKSYPSLDPESLTLERAISDTVELTDHLRRRFGQSKIYLAGESWGTTLGVLTVQRHPERYHAWIGSGQMVSQRETDRRLYDEVIERARRTGDEELERTMRGFGRPPYTDLMAYAVVMGQYAALAPSFEIPRETQRLGESHRLYAWGIGQPEYTLLEKTFVFRGFLDMGARMYPQLQGLDFRRDVPSLDVPVYLFQGEHELEARADLADEWFEALQAPRKRVWRLAHAGHSTVFEECGEFHRLMTTVVLPETGAL